MSRTTPATAAPAWRLGTIGFAYAEWAGTFYPPGLDAGRRLEWYASRFNAVEIDATFYATPRPAIVRRWAESTPETFRFALKAPRLVTHEGELARPANRDAMSQFLDVARELREKLGVVLVQFPARFRNLGENLGELERFVMSLPSELSYAIEFRHRSWWTRPVAERMRSWNASGGTRVAWVAADQPTPDAADRVPGDLGGDRGCPPRPLVVVGDLLYVRWVGDHGQFADATAEVVDPTPRLRWWADRLAPLVVGLSPVREIYGFFGNAFAGHAPATLKRFAEAANLEIALPSAGPVEAQGLLF